MKQTTITITDTDYETLICALSSQYHIYAKLIDCHDGDMKEEYQTAQYETKQIWDKIVEVWNQ